MGEGRHLEYHAMRVERTGFLRDDALGTRQAQVVDDQEHAHASGSSAERK